MPVIAIASPRSGTGKSTLALLLADELARIGTVALLDAGARGEVAAWAKQAPGPDGFMFLRSAGASVIAAEIRRGTARARFVVVDLDGMASPAAREVMPLSDLVLIPTRERFDDVASLPGALSTLRQARAAAGRDIAHGVVLSRRRQPLGGPGARQIVAKLEAMEGLHLLRAALDERPHIASLLSNGGVLRTLASDDDPDGLAAIESVEAVAGEMLALLGVKRAQGVQPSDAARHALAVTQFSIRGPRWIADEFRALCNSERRTHADMLRILLETYQRSGSDR